MHGNLGERFVEHWGQLVRAQERRRRNLLSQPLQMLCLQHRRWTRCELDWGNGPAFIVRLTVASLIISRRAVSACVQPSSITLRTIRFLRSCERRPVTRSPSILTRNPGSSPSLIQL